MIIKFASDQNDSKKRSSIDVFFQRNNKSSVLKCTYLWREGIPVCIINYFSCSSNLIHNLQTACKQTETMKQGEEKLKYTIYSESEAML